MNKRQKFIVVEHKSNLNAALKNTFQFSQRIKFTCLDVSLNYIVFGATSGGLYIFKRYPHVMIKLIPNKHGALTLLSVSPNEKYIALSTSRGIIVVITNCFTGNDFQYHTYSEDKTSVITAIKWNNNEELYYGNNLGNVGVITVPNLLTKAIFQTPRALIMQLDSSICQIDCNSPLLLVSTLTRTYLCDTEKEQFIQIGKKLRNGNFGACFFFDNEIEKGTESEEIISKPNSNIKIFCNRPGARIWEAKLDTTVACTHQLKDFFKQNLDSWICLEENNDSHSNMLQTVKQKPESQESLNFTNMLVLQHKFILTFNNEGFFIFDPETLAVIYYYNNFNNVKDIKVAKNFIYVCLENMDVRIFGLYSLENIILKTLFNQQYHACLEICINYSKEVLELIETSERIYLLTVLENKVCDCFTSENVNNTLKLIFDALQNCTKQKLTEKLNNAIVVVNNGYFNESLNENIIDDCVNNDKSVIDSRETDMKILLQQYEWSQINDRVEISKYKGMLDKSDPNKLAIIFQNFNVYMSEKDIDVKLWSYNSYVKYFSTISYKQIIDNNEIDDNSMQFLVKGFCLVNYSCSCSCSCFYPLPSASLKKPQFYDVGCALLNNTKSTNTQLYKQLVTDVPFMWKYVIEGKEDDIDILLPLILQFNNADVFTRFLKKFKYDTWDNAIKILIKLQQKKCINCEKQFAKGCDVIKWKQLASFMIQSIGAQSTVNLLRRYAAFISSEDLDATFYQSCIFAAAFDNFSVEPKSHASIWSKTVVKNTVQLDELIAKYLNDKYKATSHTHGLTNMPFLKQI